jgi:dolichol-phosphate mannosyltransferase
MKISIIVPAYNEEENIISVIHKIEEVVAIDHELIVVNDHSSDRTRELVTNLLKQYPKLRLIDNELESGFANALRSGFLAAGADAIVPVMGDLCDDLATIKLMAKKIEEGFDVVCGSRYIRGGCQIGGPRFKRLFSRLGGFSVGFFLGIPVHDISNAFKMYKKEVIKSIELKAQGFEISMELPVKAHLKGFKITEVPTVWRDREAGQSSFKVFVLLPRYIKLYAWALGKRLQKAISLKP